MTGIGAVSGPAGLGVVGTATTRVIEDALTPSRKRSGGGVASVGVSCAWETLTCCDGGWTSLVALCGDCDLLAVLLGDSTRDGVEDTLGDTLAIGGPCE
mmetsp:Transcript_103733/g.188956  ORF Transcript_103733/g.188956 Transcript_103733/m.188956 type:complete len:99 (+) Transcript_103733:304-600(+)